MKSPERKLSERGLNRINDCNDSHVENFRCARGCGNICPYFLDENIVAVLIQ